MGNLLHVTNGDVAAELLRASGVAGTVLAWRDVLHEGPVPAGLGLRELSARRAEFLAGEGYGDLDPLRDEFSQRDATLEGFRRHGEVVLWFEHDLNDQLQILQLLDLLGRVERGATRLSMICIGSYPGIEPFHGLGQLHPRQLAGLLDRRGPVTAAQLALARSAWSAFREPDPTRIEQLLDGDTSSLEFLAAALRRHLEQFPAVGDGLGRTERQALEVVRAGPRTAAELFRANRDRETRPFLGDTTFYRHVRHLADGPRPLLRIQSDRTDRDSAPPVDVRARATVSITGDGLAVLEGRAERIALRGIDRWLGGVHLRDGGPLWRWDRGSGRLRAGS